MCVKGLWSISQQIRKFNHYEKQHFLRVDSRFKASLLLGFYLLPLFLLSSILRRGVDR